MKIFVLSAAVALFAVAANSAGSGTAQAAIVAEYTLGEDSSNGPPVDVTGNHNFVNNQGNPTVDTTNFAPAGGSTASLFFTPAVGFYGVANVDGSYPLTDNFIVDIWAKASSTSLADNRLVSTDGTGSAATGSLQLGVTGGFYTADISNGSVMGTVFSTGPAVTTDWTELTLERLGGTTTFLVNGVPQPGTTTVEAQVGVNMHLSVTPGGASSFAGNLDQFTVLTVPEPSSVALLGAGALGLFLAMRRRRAC